MCSYPAAWTTSAASSLSTPFSPHHPLPLSFRSSCCYCVAFLASFLAVFGQTTRELRQPGGREVVPSSYFAGFKSALAPFGFGFRSGSTCFDKQQQNERLVSFSFALVGFNLPHSSPNLRHFPVGSTYSRILWLFHLAFYFNIQFLSSYVFAMKYDHHPLPHRNVQKFCKDFLFLFSFLFWSKLSPLLFSFRFDFVCVLSQMICCST